MIEDTPARCLADLNFLLNITVDYHYLEAGDERGAADPTVLNVLSTSSYLVAFLKAAPSGAPPLILRAVPART